MPGNLNRREGAPSTLIIRKVTAERTVRQNWESREVALQLKCIDFEKIPALSESPIKKLVFMTVNKAQDDVEGAGHVRRPSANNCLIDGERGAGGAGGGGAPDKQCPPAPARRQRAALSDNVSRLRDSNEANQRTDIGLEADRSRLISAEAGRGGRQHLRVSAGACARPFYH
ncbi:hypothetical protein EVAR_26548_1 [Eumeta japonica]|uniref:Uncharacterized protein n=1 Tax=Eumeta variegata TaxID=151549 RepID=A0A4C1W520_EUMVA|nr:hypothetical protein EVAR_26548_1 [Eumeta japonica]